MRRWRVLSVVCGILGAASLARAQSRWDDPATLALVDRAIARRTRQLADSTLKDYAATAHGYVTFLAQLGDGFAEPPKVIRTDELAVEVYWRAPDRSKQRIIGRRDTTLVPTDLSYHRDHLVIVQGNFPEIIRLGDGDEVRDVAHPLSAAGRAAYEFAIIDSLPIRTSDRAIDVIEVALRPRDATRPAAIGSVFLERESATVVRLALTFTRAALRDPALDDVAVILENGLVDGRYWLPRRQEIEIRRSGSVLDFPARGIIRGRWEITEVRPNLRLPEPIFAGAEIVQLPGDSLRAYRFPGAILDALPSSQRAVEPRDVERVQQRARELVAVRALERGSGTAIAARRLSELVRMNRNEGLALGAGLTRTVTSALTVGGTVRFGFADHRAKGRVELGWHGATTRLRLGWLDELAEAGTVAEASGLRNTIAAQEFGADLTALYRLRGAQIALERRRESGARVRVSFARESHRVAPVTAMPVRGRFAVALDATPLSAWRAALGVRVGTPITLGAWRVTGDGEVQALRSEREAGFGPIGSTWHARAVASAQATSDGAAGSWRLRADAVALAGPRSVPTQWRARAGGPVSGPGYAFHEFVGRSMVSTRAEFRHRIPFPVIPLGRFGRTGGEASLMPYGHAVGITGSRVHRAGVYPAAGLGVGLFSDLVRLDVANGLRGGRWRFAVDLTTDFWPIL